MPATISIDESDESDVSDESDEWEEHDGEFADEPPEHAAVPQKRAADSEELYPAPKRRKTPNNVRRDVWINSMGKTWEGKCVVCSNRTIEFSDFQVGHVVAHARGGTDHVTNLRPICAPCNRSMGTQNLYEYRATYYGGADGGADGSADGSADVIEGEDDRADGDQ